MSNQKKKQPKRPQETPAEIRERQLAKKKAEKKARMKKRGKHAGIVLGCLLAAGGIVLGTQLVLSHTGWLLHRRVAAQTEHFTVDQAMLCCYFEDCRQSFDRYLTENPQVTGYDPEQPLDKQQKDKKTTWYDFFLDSAVDSVRSILQTCETAHEAGFALSADQIAECRQQAAEFDSSRCPKGVRTEDVEHSFTLRRIATEYRKQFFDAVPLADDDLAAYYAEHKNDYLSWDMLCYSFSWNGEEESKAKAAQDQAIAGADELAKCKTPDEFREFVRAYVTKERDAETAEAEVASLPRSGMGRQYAANAEKWVTEEHPALYDTFTDLTLQSASVQVFMLMSQPEENNAPTADLRVIALSDRKYETADKALAQAEEIRKQVTDAESFGKLAMQYSEDATTKYSGGKLEAYSGSNESYGTAAAAWAFDPARKTGDMMTDRADGVTLLFYYEQQNPHNVWQNAVHEDLYQQAAAKYAGKLRAVMLTENEEYEQVPL